MQFDKMPYHHRTPNPSAAGGDGHPVGAPQRPAPCPPVARFLWGALNGNIGVVKTYLSEVCDDSNQAKGMAILSTSFGFGPGRSASPSHPTARCTGLGI